ncbi:hypothetical protein [Kutzneria sp. CA-103260]|uniref:hypothetical protein n=1 Tax=Kutzneria sp. CA-103260 TaxID=2802641 RepID=UPI001BAC6324|nr:hypothetical protein [Kutzneria sp. CA-103260]QUQ64981.1 D-alanine--D-alanine ligase [Kutzneria sp. CA-103260]
MPIIENRPVGVLAGGRGVLQGSSEVVAGRVKTLLESADIAAAVFQYGSEEFAAALARGDLRLLQDVTYGVYGRAESLAAAAGLGFVGTGARQAEVYDKVRLKTFLSRSRVRTPAHVVLDAHAQPSSWSAISLLAGPIVVKPATADLLSAGVRFFDAADPWQPELREHIGQLFALDQTVLVERYVPGLEICLGYEVSRRGFEMYRPLTITKEALLFDHSVKTSKRYAFTPVDVPASALRQLSRLGRTMAAEFDLTGCFYVNAIVADDGDVSVFDAGATVGLTEHSYFPAAAALRGDALDDLLVRQFVEPVEDLLRRESATQREPAEMETR